MKKKKEVHKILVFVSNTKHSYVITICIIFFLFTSVQIYWHSPNINISIEYEPNFSSFKKIIKIGFYPDNRGSWNKHGFKKTF